MGRRNLKKLLVLSISIILFYTIGGPIRAEEGLTEAEEKAKALEEAKREIDNTSWKIELKPIVTGKEKPKGSEEDILRFVNNQIISDKLEAEGFSSSNYTVRIKRKDSGIVIWETMQTSEKKGAAFWRGEIRNDKMRGVLSWHINEKNKKSYTFVSMTKENIPEEIESPEPVTKVVEEPVEIPIEQEIVK